MNVVSFLLAVGAVAGVLLGLFCFRLAAVLVSNLILSVLAAAVLQNQGFGFFAGVASLVACQTVQQFGYALGSLMANRESSLAGDQPNDDPGERGHNDVGRQYKE